MELIGAGRSLLIYPQPDSKPHVWFVLTDPVGMPGKVVAGRYGRSRVVLRPRREEDLVARFTPHPTGDFHSTFPVARRRS